jgi:putative endonuclease
MKNYYVYMMTNKIHTVLYTGVTSALETRNAQHKRKAIKGFTSKYNVQKLVYFEYTNDVYSAIAREKQIKGWARKKKDALVSSVNPGWKDLSEEWYQSEGCFLPQEREILRFAQDDKKKGSG